VAVHLAAQVFDLGFGETLTVPPFRSDDGRPSEMDTHAGHGHSSNETASTPEGPSNPYVMFRIEIIRRLHRFLIPIS